MAKLKLFRTASGFHDSFVAAPSRAAALKAWGARTDLFAMGSAEQVDDPTMLEEASRTPGEVLQRRRIGQTGALKRRPPTAKPRVDLGKLRATLAAAERALKSARAAAEKEFRAIDKERASLDRREQAARRRQASAEKKLSDTVNRARQRLEDAS